MTDYPPTLIQLTYTATDDNTFKIALTPMWLEYADVFVTLQDALMGSRQDQLAPIFANDIYTFPYPVNLSDLFFKNKNAGSNTVVTIIGTSLTRKKATEHGITLPP